MTPRDASGHPADRQSPRPWRAATGAYNIVGIAVGNEIPGDIVRVHGIAAVEDTLSSLIALIHDESDLPATYVNFPTTEFLEPAGQDFVSFNVFLEDPDDLRRYLRHLQVVALDRPLIVTELGLPSLVHGEDTQASSLESQLRVVDETGCAGATVFSWTDDWGVAGVQVDGWGFGVTTSNAAPSRRSRSSRPGRGDPSSHCVRSGRRSRSSCAPSTRNARSRSAWRP